MIIVDAILNQQFPVRPDIVFLRAGDDLHLAGRRLVDNEIDVLLGLAQIAVEIDRVGVEIGKIEVAVLLEPRDGDQAHFLLIERGAIGIGARHRFQPAIRMIGPAVIHAVELPSVAFALAAHQRAAMPAAIDERMDLALAVAAEDDRPPGHRARLEVAGILELRAVPDINPAAVQDAALLPLQHILGDEHLAIDEEGLLVGIFDHEIVAERLVIHERLRIRQSVAHICRETASRQCAP